MADNNSNTRGGYPAPADEGIHATALRHANEAWTAEMENYDNARDDQRFYAGEQWLADAKQERSSANRPVITVNRIPGFVRQVTGDVRKDTPAIKVVPSHGGADEELSEIFSGLIRNIEVQSNAKAAYVQATENACITGLGVIGVKTQYSSDDAFEQDIRIERIRDPFAVLFDPAAKEPDKSDARYIHYFVDVPKEEYAKLYPNQPFNSMPTGPNAIQGLSWYNMESIRISHYWYKKPVKKQLLLLSDGRTLDAKAALAETKSGTPIDVVMKRTVDTFEVEMIIMNGVEVLSGPHEWAGKYLPFAPVIGEEIMIEGRVIRRGMVRDAKDPQRVYNYMRTAAVEAAALQPKAPFILTVDQIKGYEKMWSEAGSKNQPYLVYVADPRAPGEPKRSPPALAQNGLDSQATIAANDLQGVIGIYNVSLGAESKEVSGRAILARQKQGDTGTFNYVDNLATAIRHVGRILVDLIPKIYDTPRIIRVLGEDGDMDMTKINQEHQDEASGLQKFNDMSVGEYDVIVMTGPSFATKRQEASETMLQLAQSMPEVMKIAADLIVRNMDIPGAEQIADRIFKTIPPAITDEGPPQPPQPDPKMIAEVEVAASVAALNRAKTEGQEITNVETGIGMVETLANLHMSIQQMQAQLQSLAFPQATPQAQPTPSPPPGMAGPPQGPGPAAPPMNAPPMSTPREGLPPMAELEPMHN